MKEEKFGLTPLNWFLSILGIIILLAVIVIPPVFRVVFKVETSVEEVPEEVIITTMTCSKSGITATNSIDSETISFDFANDKLFSYIKKTEKKYSDSVFYNNDKQLFGRYVAAFSILSGYKYSVDPDDNNYILSTEELYDLDAFQNTVITIPGDTAETQVNSTYNKNDLASQIRNDLLTAGYACQ